MGWIAVDLDGTLAYYEKWISADHIGAPIPAMVERVKQWLSEGKEVRIFTARVDIGLPTSHAPEATRQQLREFERVRDMIQDWCELHIGTRLPVTNVKDYAMWEMWDDRAVRVMKNEGRSCCDHHRG